MPHKCNILRLKDERPENKIAVLKRVLELYSDELVDNFTVVTEKTVRTIEQRNERDKAHRSY